MYADHGALAHPDQLHESRRTEDLALAVAGQVVGEGLDLAVTLPCLLLGESDRGDLGIAVGDPGDARLVDRGWCHPGDLLGYEDALLEAAVGQLQAWDDVADRVEAVDSGAQPLVGDDEAAVQGDALLGEAQALGGGSAADCDEEYLCRKGVATGEGHFDAVVSVLHGFEGGAGQRHDAALAEGSLQGPRARLVL